MGNDVLVSMLEAHPQYLGVYYAFEPDAFDGNDAENRNTPGTDESGRYLPYFTLDDQQNLFLQPCTALEDEYYQYPKRT